MKHFLRFTLIVVLIIQACPDLVAQGGSNGIIKGTITDALSGEPLIGTNVAIEGTSMGTSSDLNGEYMITNIPAGTLTVLFRYIGYKQIDLPDVQLTAGQTLELNMEMSPEAIMGEEVVITIQAKGQRAAINQQLASNAITNIVSSDKIRDVPDVNAAESIGRLPGVALQRSGGEGEKVVIRGLSPKFSIIEVDGVRMSGASGDRSVGLSTVSSEMLDGIELSKSLTADKDADAIGGVVNLRTRVADEGFHFNVYGTGGYNNLHNSFNNYKLTGSVGNRFFDNKFGVLVSGGIEQVDRSADEFSAGYASNPTEEGDQLLTNNAELREVKRMRERANGSLVLDYKNDWMNLKFNNIYSQRKDNVEQRVAQYIFSNSNYNYNILDEYPEESFQLHSLGSEFKIGSTVLEADYSYSKSGSTRDRDLYHFEDNESLSASPIGAQQRIFAKPGDLITEFYNGAVTPEKSVVRWNEKENEIRKDVTHTANASWKVPYRIGGVSGFVKVGGRYKKKNRSNDRTTSWTYFHGGIGDGRMDMFYNNVYPDFIRPVDVGSTNGNGLAAVNFEDPNYDYGNFLDGRYNFQWAADLDYLKEVFGNTYDYVRNDPDLNIADFHQIRGPQSYSSDYETEEQLMAGYVMAEINIGNLMLLPGIRYENIQTVYSSNFVQENYFDNKGLDSGYPIPVTAERQNTHWFPSLNLKYDVTEWMDIRGAYYKSVSRPDFALLSPSLVRDQDFLTISSYNPYLKPALADNYDLGVSFYTNKIGLITINGFYKSINDLVYRIPEFKPSYTDELEESGAPASLIESLRAPESLYDSTELYTSNTINNNRPVNNPNKSTYYGIEFSWQSNFWYLPGLLSGLVLDLNYAMIWSATKLPYVAFEQYVDSSGFFPITNYRAVYDARESRMLDQPSQLFNARIGWDYKGFSTRLSFRYQASTITRVDPIHSLLDEINQSMFRIDLNVRQKITPRLAVSLDIANLNNYIDDRVVDALGRIYPRSSEYYGVNVILGVRYDF